MTTSPPECLHVERLTEPFTGWPLLGVGAAWDAPPHPHPLVAEVLLDDVVRQREPVSRTPTGYRFGTQLPAEPAVRLTVRLVAGDESVTVYDGPAEAPPRPLTVDVKSSPLRTAGRALASGDLFELEWWAARRRRYTDLALRGRQRVRDKLHARRVGPHDPYRVFLRTCVPNAAALAAMRRRAEGFRYKPVFSLLVPVFNAPKAYLMGLETSVQRQAYPHWELCLADDASTDADTQSALRLLERSRGVRLVRRPANGHICAATNSAAEQATGEFLVFADNDDVLAPHALFRVAELLQQHPDADLIYSDEDKLNDAGRFDPQLKPGWSPDLLLSYNFVNHLTVIRRTLFEAVGRYRLGYEGSQDHDLLLRLTERTDRIHHIPDLLYHWRAHANSTAVAAGVKPYVQTAGRKAVVDALARRGIDATLYQPAFAERLGLPILGLDGPDDGPTVAVVIHGPSSGATVRAVKATTSYRSLTTYLVLDDTADALNRHAAGRTEEFLLFLRAGVEPTDPRWLSRLLAYAKLPEVGACGGLVRDPAGGIASAGTALDGDPVDALAGPRPEPTSYYFYAEVARTVAAPGGGVLLTRRSHFERAGGFDADRFGRTLWDVDYARRLAGLGLRSVHVGGAEFRTAAGVRRDSPTERLAFRTAHPDPDPYHRPPPRPDPPHLVAPLPAGTPVLFGTHNLQSTEGAPKIIRDIAVSLHRRGAVRASLFAPAPGVTPDGIEAFADEQPWGRRFIDGRWTPTEYAAAQRHLRTLLKRVKPAAVVANTAGLFPLADAAIRLGVPSVLCLQETYPPPLRSALFSRFAEGRLAWAMRNAGRVIFASDDCRAAYADLGLCQDVVVPNGLDAGPIDAFLKRAPKPPGDGLRVVCVGTVCERKAQHVLVEAAALVPGLTVSLVGCREGLPYLGYVRALAAARGVSDRIEFIAETPDVWPHLRAADVFACCSHVEAYSLSVLEGLAFGLPVVSTPCGGLSQQVTWGANALRFAFDDHHALAGHLRRLADDATLRAEMGRQARAGFDLLPSAADTSDRYARVIAAAVREAAC